MKQNYALLVALTILATLWATASLIVFMGVLTIVTWQGFADTPIDNSHLVWVVVSFLNVILGAVAIAKIEGKIDDHATPKTFSQRPYLP